MALQFSATSLEQCIEKASFELNMPKEALKYRIIKEEKKFFKKRVEIEILTNEDNIDDVIEKEIIEDVDGNKEQFGAKVENGKILIVESEKKDNIITIKSCSGVSLFINGQRNDQITPVTAEDKIEYKIEEVEPIRNAEIFITNDKMEAYIDIKSNPGSVYEVVDQGLQKNLVLSKKKVSDKYPPKYTPKEIKELLQSQGIRYGIIENEVEAVSNEYIVENRLIAKGLPAQDDISDEIQVLFKESEELIEHNDSEEKVDYRNRFLIANVSTGDIIGKIIPGKGGSDGQNIFGVPIKRKTAKKVTVKIGEGCKIENDTIIATTEGKPAFKANTFNINKLYKVEEVDLKSGNIDFVGNVEVTGTVSEAMEVKAGNELQVGKNVESALIKASGEITINGNALHSIIIAGGENVERKQYLNNLVNLKSIMSELGSSAEQIKDNHLLGNRQDGEIIKILIENKFKTLPKLSRDILNYNMSQGIQHSEVTIFIISKLLGLGPLKIQNYKELNNFEEMIEQEIEQMEQLIIMPTDVYLAYAQSSTIEASGSVYITGKGQYTSNITALNNIEFISEKSVCRGGILKAGSEIKLKTVGSAAGVNTILKVSKTGRITADIAYNNTIFCFGERQIMLEVSSKNVEAYVDSDGEIIIDKFVL